MTGRRHGSLDDQPGVVPAHDLGPIVVPMDYREVLHLLKRMRRDVAIGVYAEDMPPVGQRGSA